MFNLMQQAMFRVEEEFRSVMECGGESYELSCGSSGNLSFDSEEEDEEGEDHEIPVQLVTDYDSVIDVFPSGTINDLHEIANCMVTAGFGKECSHVYSSCRHEFL
jgi:hypothetical protein